MVSYGPVVRALYENKSPVYIHEESGWSHKNCQYLQTRVGAMCMFVIDKDNYDNYKSFRRVPADLFVVLVDKSMTHLEEMFRVCLFPTLNLENRVSVLFVCDDAKWLSVQFKDFHFPQTK